MNTPLTMTTLAAILSLAPLAAFARTSRVLMTCIAIAMAWSFAPAVTHAQDAPVDPDPQQEEPEVSAEQAATEADRTAARSAMAESRWEDAEAAWKNVLATEPGDAEAVKGLASAQAAIDQASTISGVQDDLQLRRQRALIEFNAGITLAGQQLSEGDYDGAQLTALTAKVRLDRNRNILAPAAFQEAARRAETLLEQISDAKINSQLVQQDMEREQARAASSLTSAQDIPARPEDLTFPELAFTPPEASTFRSELPGGIPLYMAPSHEFPLISLTLSFDGGEYLVDEDTTGLGSALGSLLRTGGTHTASPTQMDEDFDFLAAMVSTGVGSRTTTASLNCLVANFDEAFNLFMDMLQNPAFDAERLELWRTNTIEAMKQRNDNADSISRREFRTIMAADHFSSRSPTLATVESIDQDKLRALHKRIVHPGNMIVAATGDFDPAEMTARLSEAFAGWEAGEALPEPPAPQTTSQPGVYRIEKDIPQGKVLIGTRSIERDDPDYFTFLLLNQVLGGGAFTSRITSRVRSDEGLAYSAGSSFMPGVDHPGVFVSYFQSKSPTVALATKIIFEELDRVRQEPISAEELETARRSFIETFPQNFSSREAMLDLFVSDERTDRPAGYWQNYRARLADVTPAEMLAVAKKYLDPETMRILVVGKWDEIYAGDETGRASMNDIFDGDSIEIPLRDPLTLEQTAGE